MYRLSFNHTVYERKYRQKHPGVLEAAEHDGVGYLFDERPPTDGMGATPILEEVES